MKKIRGVWKKVIENDAELMQERMKQEIAPSSFGNQSNADTMQESED